MGGCYPDAHDARLAGCGPKSATQLMLVMLAGGGLLPNGQLIMLQLMLVMLAGGGLLPNGQLIMLVGGPRPKERHPADARDARWWGLLPKGSEADAHDAR